MKIDTASFKILLLLISLLIFSVPLMGQGTVRVNEIFSPDNIVIFYVGDFGLTDASSPSLIFEYELSATEYPQTIKITFVMEATVPSLDLINTEIIFAQTNDFEFNGSIRISNRQLAQDLTQIIDSNGDIVNFSVPVQRNIGDSDPARRDALIESVTRSGKLPAGAYSFSFIVESITAESVDNPFENKIINITNPTTLDLVGPGGFLADEIEIFTLFPIFQWESQGCEYAIRVSNYDPAVHSSVEEALNDVSNLPFPDDGSYFAGSDGDGLESTTLQYPLSGAKQLEYGKTYVWSVKKTCITTAGEEVRDSDIFAFKIADITGEGDDPAAGIGAGGVITDPVLAALQSIFGDAFEAYFTGDGELAGFTTVASIFLNGETATAEAVSGLAEDLLSGEIEAVQIEIQ